ncbi:SAYSvFN domain-containing protein 1 isoform X2 [Suricata suricatta]|uniref:SAYSvFN domain-containing protein 1 isoform X2 n=1 Tax=Suricata suricatta TaxID=37032 RepID=UPI001155C127|nr:SAYSvFN domain-containing protein 1 isoform X2 [Suricata suricatta]
MEQRLAEFREARKRAGLTAEPSQNSQTSGKKAEAAATPKAAPGWLKRFLVCKPRPANIRAQPSLAQLATHADPDSGRKEYEIIELDPEKLNVEKVNIIKTQKLMSQQKDDRICWTSSQFLLIILFFIRDSVLSSFSLAQLSFLGLLWCENYH